MPYNMVNFGPLTAEIRWRVWGTPANFNGFRVLAALLHGTPVVGSAELCGTAVIMLGIGPHSSSRLTYWNISLCFLYLSQTTIPLC